MNCLWVSQQIHYNSLLFLLLQLIIKLFQGIFSCVLWMSLFNWCSSLILLETRKQMQLIIDTLMYLDIQNILYNLPFLDVKWIVISCSSYISVHISHSPCPVPINTDVLLLSITVHAHCFSAGSAFGAQSFSLN